MTAKNRRRHAKRDSFVNDIGSHSAEHAGSVSFITKCRKLYVTYTSVEKKISFTWHFTTFYVLRSMYYVRTKAAVIQFFFAEKLKITI